MLVVSTFSSLAEELGDCLSAKRQWKTGREWHTLKDGTGQVTLVLAATGSGGRTVWVGVLPLLKEFFGLVEEDLSERERRKSQ